MPSWWVRWRLKSPASWLFTQPFVQVQIKENIKAPSHWHLCGEPTGDRWHSPHKRPGARKIYLIDDVIMQPYIGRVNDSSDTNMAYVQWSEFCPDKMIPCNFTCYTDDAILRTRIFISNDSLPNGLQKRRRGNQQPSIVTLAWASFQIRKIAGCACTGNTGNSFPPPPNSKETTC